MSDKTIVLITTNTGGVSEDFWSRMRRALNDAGCRVEKVAAADTQSILGLLESGAVPVVER